MWLASKWALSRFHTESGLQASTGSVAEGNGRVAVVNVWSDHNRGDAAIVQATCDLLRRWRPGLGIDLHNVVFAAEGTRDLAGQHFGAFQGLQAELFPALFPSMVVRRGRAAVSQVSRLLYGIRAMLLLILAALNPGWPVILLRGNERGAFESLRRSEFVVSKGGSYLLGERWTSCLKITMVMFPLVLARMLGRPTALLGVSVGPATSRAASIVMSYWFRWVDEFVVREEHAFQTCLRLGVPRERLTLLPDIAFSLSENGAVRDPVNTQRPEDTVSVAVTVRRWRFDDLQDGRDQENVYLTSVAEALTRFCAATGAELLLVPQVIGPNADGSDIGALNRLQSLIPSGMVVRRLPENLDVKSLQKVYADADMLVGTRLHSVILAFGTPTVIIGYQGNKSIGTAALLGVEDCFLHINDVTAGALYEKIDYVWRNRTEIRNRAERIRAGLDATFALESSALFSRLGSYEGRAPRRRQHGITGAAAAA
jgi:colanic acid/amylovoran biosynthesis protein